MDTRKNGYRTKAAFEFSTNATTFTQISSLTLVHLPYHPQANDAVFSFNKMSKQVTEDDDDQWVPVMTLYTENAREDIRSYTIEPYLVM
jgi:hypothetical protein